MEVNQLSVCAVRTYVDISPWWPCDGDGKPVSVNSVFTRFTKTPMEVNRYTLTRALNGKLEKGDFESLVKLARICSELSGKTVTIIDLIQEKDT